MSKLCRMCDKPIIEKRTYCSYKCSSSRPEHILQARNQIIKYNKSPAHRLVASKIAKKYGPPALIRYNKSEKHRKYMREVGSIIGTQNLSKTWNDPEHKKRASKQMIKYNKSDEHKKIASKVGKIYGVKNVESGQIFEALKKARQHKHIIHFDHKHARTAEYVECLKHYACFPKDWVHALVRVGSREVDWVISPHSTFNDKDPSTWLYVIEYHPPVHYGSFRETFSEYKNNRVNVLRRLGVSCPILVYYTEQQWIKLVSLYDLHEIEEEVNLGVK